MWMMLQEPQAGDFVLATGESHSVRGFVELAFKRIGIDIEWNGTGVDEKGIDAASGNPLIEVDARYFRPTEVDALLGDATRAREILGWEPKIAFKDLVFEMVDSDLKNMKDLGSA